MPSIPLYLRGAVVGEALVDEEDFAYLSQWTWRRRDRHKISYAVRSEWHRGITVDIFMHRVILGCGEGEQGDHKNGDGLDNRRSNLRKLAPGQNQQNIRSHQGSTSQYRGVWWDKRCQRWRARVHHSGRNYWLGYFASELEAAQVALAKRLELFPFAIESLVR